MKYELGCTPIDRTHPEINGMVDSSIDDTCYFFKPCLSSSHKSILKKCQETYPKLR